MGPSALTRVLLREFSAPRPKTNAGRGTGGTELRFWWNGELDRAYTLARLVRAPGKRQETKAEAMLPPFIIDQIRRREEEETRKQELEQPRLELPQDAYPPSRDRRPSEDRPDDEGQRGVLILEL